VKEGHGLLRFKMVGMARDRHDASIVAVKTCEIQTRGMDEVSRHWSSSIMIMRYVVEVEACGRHGPVEALTVQPYF
jgi:hypothetical protein